MNSCPCCFMLTGGVTPARAHSKDKELITKVGCREGTQHDQTMTTPKARASPVSSPLSPILPSLALCPNVSKPKPCTAFSPPWCPHTSTLHFPTSGQQTSVWQLEKLRLRMEVWPGSKVKLSDLSTTPHPSPGPIKSLVVKQVPQLTTV